MSDLREALWKLVEATSSCPDALMQGTGSPAEQNLYRWWDEVAAPALREARAALSEQPSGLDVAAMAEALWFEGLGPQDEPNHETARSLIGAYLGMQKHRAANPSAEERTAQ